MYLTTLGITTTHPYNIKYPSENVGGKYATSPPYWKDLPPGTTYIAPPYISPFTTNSWTEKRKPSTFVPGTETKTATNTVKGHYWIKY